MPSNTEKPDDSCIDIVHVLGILLVLVFGAITLFHVIFGLA